MYKRQDLQDLWEYWSYKGGGNGYGTEVAFLRVHPDHVVAAVETLDADLRALPRLTPSPGADPEGGSTSEQRVVETSVQDEEPDHEEEPTWYVPTQLAHVLTWQLAAQLVRRHPEDLWVINTHPLDGFYDCLGICDLQTKGDRLLAHLNRRGSGLALPDGTVRRWTRGWEEDDPRPWILRLEDRLGLTPPRGQLPPSTPSSLAVRWIAQLLSIQLSGRDRWFVTGGAPRPAGGTEISFPGLPGVRNIDERSCWTLGPGVDDRVTDPQVVVTVNGVVHRRGKDPVNLSQRHTSGSSMTRLVLDVVPDLVP